MPYHLTTTTTGTTTGATTGATTGTTTGVIDLAHAVGQLELDHSLFTGSLLAAAVNEFAASAGRDWHFDPGATTAALLRALAYLSITAPDVRSASAQVLLDAHRDQTVGAS